jgi:PIN domain nuclease of toxin-antitoxin system
MLKRYVLDACALIAFLRNEEGIVVVRNLLANEDTEIYIHKVSLLEVYYDTIYYADKSTADRLFEILKMFPIIITEDLTDSFIKKAGVFKASFRISLGDSFVLACAQQLDATVVTADHHEFDSIENTGLLKFEWIR